MSQIGSNIKKLRKVKGLSQQAFADLFSLTRGNISSYEERRAEPKIEVILQIAKYFSIPVAQLLEKQLTVNEILNFEDYFEDSTTLMAAKNMSAVPFIGRENFLHANRKIDVTNMPKIYFPIYHKQNFLALENCSFIPKPLIFPFEENAILFFEPVEIAILHTLDQHYGVYLGADELFFGQYQTNGNDIELILNDWMKKGFAAEKKSYFWKLYGKFEKVV
ncbi:helix-turn-helix domain-containing protein [Sphingobacterium chuzhouense]|uniref:Helix-turn-helix transcriptional regulator n=1 Tax=Sphingobacterium chuzhouense TaxID=1742264 RepID=A0ABR7XNB8_9SPHI|nr:helix-turn-helix transcriptional regulator [Sphingobacterium chuzhouense]MBD1420657.1 helix-turn-helix transcriptional regulator [Sphingobacterium chuzhouense]